QIEEAYTLVADENVRSRFLRAGCSAADDVRGPVRAVFTVRDDFLGRLAESGELEAALRQVTVLRKPGPEALRDILCRPIEAMGYRYQDEALVEEMIQAVREEPACLPLLQFAGQMLWERRDREQRLIRRQAYEAMGRITGVLAEHADGVLASLPPAQLGEARELLLRLVTAEGTRRVVAASTVLDGLGPGAAQVLTRLVQARLVTTRRGSSQGESEAVLELVHESLVRSWGRLARWLEESREDVAFVAEISQAAELWHRRGAREEEAWQGDALRDARAKVARLGTAVPDLVVRFLAAGASKEQRTRRRKQAFLASAISTLVAVAAIAVLVALFTVAQRKRVEEERARAQAEQARAEQREAEAQREGASAALHRGDLLEARAKLRGSLETSDSTMGRVLWGELEQQTLVWSKKLGGWVMDVAYSPDGKTVAGACADGKVYLVDVVTTAVRVLRGHAGMLTSVAYSPDGRRLAAGSWAGPIVLWALVEGSARELVGHDAGVWGVAFDTAGELLASASADTTVRLWDASSGKERLVLRGHEKSATRVVFTPEGTLFSAGQEGTVRQWDLTTGAGRVLIGERQAIFGLSYHPVGNRLVAGIFDGTVRLWQADSGQGLATLHGHQDVVTGTAFSPDGGMLASSSTDKSVRVWDLARGDSAVFGRHQGIVTMVAFSPDGRYLASSSRDTILRLWQVGARAGAAEDSGHNGTVRGLDFFPDGSFLVSGAEDKSVRTWDTNSGRQRTLLAGHQGAVVGVASSPDGRWFSSASHDRGIRIWDSASGSSEELVPRHRATASDVAFSSDGKALASVAFDNKVHLWDTLTHLSSGSLQTEAVLLSVAMSPDASLVAAVAQNGSTHVWNKSTSQLQVELRGHKGEAWGVAFTTDGRSLITSGVDGTIRRWNLADKTGTIFGRHDAPVNRLAVSPDGSLLGTPSDDGTARLWNLATGNVTAVLRGHRGGVEALRFSPDSKLAATSGADGTVRTWEVATGRPNWRAPLVLQWPPRIFTHLGWVRFDGEKETIESRALPAAAWRQAVAQQAKLGAQAGPQVAGSGDLLCLLTYDDELQLWSMSADRLLAKVPAKQVTGLVPPSPPQPPTTPDAASATTDSWARKRSEPGVAQVAATTHGCLALTGGGRAILLGSPAGTAAVRELAGNASAIAIQAGRMLIASDRKVLVLAGENGSQEASLHVEQGASALGLVGEGRLLAVGYDAGDLELVPVQPGTVKPAFSFEETIPSSVERISEGPRQTLIAGYASGDLGIWSLETGKRLRHFKLHGPIIHLLADHESRRLY
ncbi:MAG: WD40 repeat domain-containing protein, partial [Pseudomonadota bacterium]